MTVKVGVIGLGAIGERVLQKFIQHNDAEVVAVCDVSEERLSRLKERFNEIETYIHYEEMLKDESITLVYLAVPPKFHNRIALDVVKANKHLLCEKPLANSIEEAEHMAKAVVEANLVNAINFPMVYSNVYRAFKDKIMNGELGRIQRVEVQMHFTTWPRTWQQNDWIAGREQGGYIREVGPHYLQMIQDVFGPLENIRSFVDYPEDPTLCEKGFIARAELNDKTTVLLSGLSQIGQKERISFKVFGEKGTIDLRNWSELYLSEGDSDPVVIPLQREEEINMIGEVIKAINGEEALLVSFHQGYEVQVSLEKLLNKA